MRPTSIFKQALIISACLLSFFCEAQQNFDTIFHYSNYGELPYSIHQVADSSYVYSTYGADLQSNTYGVEFGKLNKDGTSAFVKYFEYPGAQCYVGFSGSLKPTFDSGWILGAAINTATNQGKGMAIKYNALGDTEFVKFIGDTSVNVFYDCIQSSDSGYVFVGNHVKYSPNINNDFWIVKTDTAGNVIWQRTLGVGVDEQAFHVIENSKHQLVISGAEANTSNWHHPYLAVYDLQGNLVKTKKFIQGALNSGGGGDLWRYGNNDYLLILSLDTVISITDAIDPFCVARLDSNFNFKWKNIYNGPESRDAFISKEISDGGVVIVGRKKDSSLNDTPIGWIAKMDSSGNKLWEHFYNRSGLFSYIIDFQETFDHGFIVCGTVYDTSTSIQNSWIMKLDSNGCLDSNCVINTGIHEVMDNQPLKVFPNPVKDHITVQTNDLLGELLLYDLKGNKVLQQKAAHELQTTMNVESLSSGIYFLQFISGNKLFVAKILKE